MSNKRKVGPFEVNPVGLGCMSLSHAYGTPPEKSDAAKLLNHALDIGYDFLDTAALYGFGANETLIGEAVSQRRSEFTLASKCGMHGVDGKRVIDGRPETIKKTLEEALVRLKTDVIDLYYLHRWDRNVPIEESVGALGDMVKAGKVRAIGLSEVSGATLRKAHAVHPIAAIQNEYSPWSRNVELGVIEATRELGTTLVAFSPTARGFLAGQVTSTEQFEEKDIRKGMPRFQGENLQHNLGLYERFKGLADALGCTSAQLSIAWVLSRADNIVPIPGTTRIKHLEENFAAGSLEVPAEVLDEITSLLSPEQIAGARYNEATQSEIDTEEYA